MNFPKKLLGMRIVCKPESVMHDYIALHGLMPLNELPLHLRKKIPRDELWIHQRRCNDSDVNRKKSLMSHEAPELFLMKTYGFTYKQAHEVAQLADKWW